MLSPLPQASQPRRLPKTGVPTLVLTVVVLAAGCSGELAPESDGIGQSLRVANGLVINGLVINGLSADALVGNALPKYGLSSTGLGTRDFTKWFDSNPESLSDAVMKYLVACALPNGETRSWTHPSTHITYTWSGLLGLTPNWASGAAVTEVEQQLITACLAVHVNKYGRAVSLSLLGEDSLGTPIPLAAGELTEFSEPEGAFFGNLFTGEGIFACSDRSLNPAESTERACGLSSQKSGTSAECPPIVHAGGCRADLHCELDATRTYYRGCPYNGKAYRALTSRLAPASIYRCGDGVCQFTERCGKGNSYDGCAADCGRCP